MAVNTRIREETREKIIAAARVEFLARGYEQTTTRDIAKVLNMTQPALYHYFSDKEQLFVEVIKRVGDEVYHDMLDILSSEYDDLVEQLTAMTKAIVDRHPRDVFTLIHGSFGAISVDSQRQLGAVFGRNYVSPIAQFFEQPALQLRRNVDARVASSFYLTSLAPLFGEFHGLTNTENMVERINQLLDLILYGVVER